MSNCTAADNFEVYKGWSTMGVGREGSRRQNRPDKDDGKECVSAKGCGGLTPAEVSSAGVNRPTQNARIDSEVNSPHSMVMMLY